MSYMCEACGKSYMRGNLVSHSKQRMHRLFKPNLHFAKIKINGISKRVKVCTKCLRKIKMKKVEQVAQVGPVEKVVKVEREQTPMVKKTTVEELMQESKPKKTTKVSK